MEKDLKYYSVIAKCGHVGRCNYIPIKFTVIAESGEEAARIVRKFKRVKHQHKDAILSVEEISYEEYLQIKEINNNDPYLKCKSKYEQKRIENLEERFEEDLHNVKKTYDKKERLARVEYKQKKFKLLEKWSKEEVYAY